MSEVSSEAKNPQNATSLLNDAFTALAEFPLVPRVVVLEGETGRGKTFAAQGFYDYLAAESGKYWRPGLAPAWPPVSHSSVLDERKRVVPSAELRSKGEPLPYLWLGLACSKPVSNSNHTPAWTIAHQLEDMVAGYVEATQGRGAPTRVVGRVILSATRGHAMELVSDAIPGLGLLNRAIDIGRQVHGELRSKPEYLERTRHSLEALINEFAHVTRKANTQPPLIILLDDAHAADAETLYLLSGLLGADAPRGITRKFMAESKARSPIPTLIVATAWPHRLQGDAFDTQFGDWLEEAVGTGITIQRVKVCGLPTSDAKDLLDSWAPTEPQIPRGDILKRVSRDRESVNPLVLAECIGITEDRRSPFGSLEINESDIAALPATPSEHLRERVEVLRRASPIAAWTLQLLTQFGPRPLTSSIEAIIATQSPDKAKDLGKSVLAVLRGHRIVSTETQLPTSSVWAPAIRADRLVLDSDIHAHLAHQSLSSHQDTAIIAAATSRLWLWIQSDLDNDLRCGHRWFLDEQRSMLAPLAEHVANSVGTSPELSHVTNLLISPLQALPSDGCLDPKTEAFLVAARFASIPTQTPDLIRVIGGASSFGSSVVGTVLSRRIRRLAVKRVEMRESLLKFLVSRSNDMLFAMELADLHAAIGNQQHAVEVLRPLATDHGEAAIRLYDLRRFDLVSNSESLLQLNNFASTHSGAAVRLADPLIADRRFAEAEELLMPHLGSCQDSAERLLKVYQQTRRPADIVAVARTDRSEKIGRLAFSHLIGAHDLLEARSLLLATGTAFLDDERWTRLIRAERQASADPPTRTTSATTPSP